MPQRGITTCVKSRLNLSSVLAVPAGALIGSSRARGGAVRTTSSHLGSVFILAAVIGVGPLSIDMYLPGLPALAAAFHAEAGSVQLTLASFFVGLALGQIAYGPASDRFGRKRPLYAGLALYTLASLGCALAPSIGSLIAWRFLQALGGCAGMVISRAVVRDLFDQRDAARVFSLLMAVMGVAPILAPAAGSALLGLLGWRAVFVTLAAFGLVTLLAVAFALPETREPGEVMPGAPWDDYLHLLTDARFVGYALSGGVALGGMFAYIAGSPFVFIELYGVSPTTYGWLFGLNALGLIGAAQLNRRLLDSWSTDQILSAANVATAVTGLALACAAAVPGAPLVVLSLPLFAFMAGLGFTQPNALAGAMGRHARRAGSAAALYGTVQFGTATLAASLVGVLHDRTARSMAGVMASCSLIALLAQRVLVQRRARRPSA